MPLNLSNRDQNSGHLFYNRRLRAAITRFSVRMKHDDRKQQAALALSAVFVVVTCGWMALLAAIKPAGLVGQSAIVGNRDTGAVFARVDGRLHPAMNLTSARLVTGSSNAPVWVKSGEIAKHPTGPMVGIPGVPDELNLSDNPTSAWAVCDTAAARGGGSGPTVTAIAGQLSGSGRAAPMREDQALFVSHRGATYLVWNGRRSRIDIADRAVVFNLGLDLTHTHPIEISTALFDAMPATEPLVVPAVPGAGGSSGLLPGAAVGTVLATRDATGSVNRFYVLLANGVQQITPFVADLLRAADSHGSTAPRVIAPDTLLRLQETEQLHVDFYPAGRLAFIDAAASPVTCVSWTKGSTDPRAEVKVLSGRGLPSPESEDRRIVGLIGTDHGPDSVEAQQALVLPNAANFVAATTGGAIGDTRESIFWVSAQGVRYGIDRDRATLSALEIDPARAVQAPWPILRIFAAGPAIDRDDALLERDSIAPETPGQTLLTNEGG